jgi:hypothetical protein
MSDLERPRSPSLSDVLRAALSDALADTHTALPAKIERYDAATQKADVKPLLKRPLRDEEGNDLEPEALPVIPSVPIAWPRGGGFFLSFPLNKGDLVTLVFHERSNDRWKSTAQGVDVAPTGYRMHDLSDAVAIPGGYPFTAPIPDASGDAATVGASNGMQIKIDALGNAVIGSAVSLKQAAALAGKSDGEIAKLAQEINTLKTLFAAWVPVPTDGGAVLKALVTPWAAAPAVTQPVGSSKVTIEE